MLVGKFRNVGRAQRALRGYDPAVIGKLPMAAARRFWAEGVSGLKAELAGQRPDLLCREDFFLEVRDASFGFGVADGHGVGGGVAHEEDLFFAAGDRGVDQVSLEHHEVRLEKRDDDDGVFRTL